MKLKIHAGLQIQPFSFKASIFFCNPHNFSEASPRERVRRKRHQLYLLQMYVELYGDGDPSQFENIPAKVYLRLRHLSASSFRDGYGNTKEFRQTLGSLRTFQFDRFEITDTKKCEEGKKKGESKYCRCYMLSSKVCCMLTCEVW